MQIYLVNGSSHLSRGVVTTLAEVCEQQILSHVSALWQSGMCRVMAGPLDPREVPTGPGVAIINIYDDPDQADLLGWHSYDPRTGRMPGAAFVNPILDAGGSLTKGANSLSTTVSHEVCEAFVNPYVADYVFVDSQTLEPKEVCDRTEGDFYEIDGVAVSNFLGARAFRDGPGPYDWMGLLKTPWEIRPGGHCSRLDIKTGEVQTHWGDRMPQWKRDLKSLRLAKGLSRVARLKAR